MTEITYQQFMANLFIITSTLFIAVVWCPLTVHVTKWKEEPPTMKKALILLLLNLFPLILVWITAVLVGWI